MPSTATLAAKRPLTRSSPSGGMDRAAAYAAGRRGAGGDDWLHEIKFDGYRLHARLDRGAVKLLPSRPGNCTPSLSQIRT